MKPQALLYLRRLMRPWGDKHGMLARGRSWLSSRAVLTEADVHVLCAVVSMFHQGC